MLTPALLKTFSWNTRRAHSLAPTSRAAVWPRSCRLHTDLSRFGVPPMLLPTTTPCMASVCKMQKCCLRVILGPSEKGDICHHALTRSERYALWDGEALHLSKDQRSGRHGPSPRDFVVFTGPEGLWGCCSALPSQSGGEIGMPWSSKADRGVLRDRARGLRSSKRRGRGFARCGWMQKDLDSTGRYVCYVCSHVG